MILLLKTILLAKSIYADMVRRRSPIEQSKSLNFFNPSTTRISNLSLVEGLDVINFSPPVTAALSEPLKWALIGKFSHGVPEIAEIGNFFVHQRLVAPFELRVLNSRQILIILHDEADFSLVWLKGLWQIGSLPMRVLKWTPHFNVWTEPAFVPVWIRLPGLPFHLFDKQALLEIASIFGKSIQVDQATASKSRISCARVCIELDLNKPVKDIFLLCIDGVLSEQTVIFENMPNYCNECSHLGHKSQDCYKNEPTKNPKYVREKDKDKQPKVGYQKKSIGKNVELLEKKKETTQTINEGGSNISQQVMQKNEVVGNMQSVGSENNEVQQKKTSEADPQQQQEKINADSEEGEIITNNSFAALENVNTIENEEVATTKKGERGGEDCKILVPYQEMSTHDISRSLDLLVEKFCDQNIGKNTKSLDGDSTLTAEEENSKAIVKHTKGTPGRPKGSKNKKLNKGAPKAGTKDVVRVLRSNSQ